MAQKLQSKFYFLSFYFSAQDCLDQNKNCPAWKTMGFCDPGSQYFTYMLTNCLKTCDLCATPRPCKYEIFKTYN